MKRTVAAVFVLLSASVLEFSPLVGDDAKSKAAAASPLDAIKALAGEWTGKASHGDEKFDATVSYRVTSGGSAVVETLFAGTPHEMITMYHMNGNDLLLTHYCAAQNQPRMRAAKSENAKKLEFKFLDGTNMDPAKDMHMHEASIELVDADHIKSEWVTFVQGKPAGSAKFDLHRKK